jgi:heat-inducible transcriptional repressor
MAKTLAPPASKRSSKNEREQKVLIGLVEHYIQTGKPVGSVTLKESGFEDLSSATLRNYFASLEAAGYLTQQHASGGRIPTHRAFKLYANEMANDGIIDSSIAKEIQAIGHLETKEVIKTLQTLADTLSKLSGIASFITLPRFDHDTILDVKVVPIDASRLLVVLITDFGQIQTETLYTEIPIHNFGAKRIENYFKSRLFNLALPENLEPDEEIIAKKFYNEAMVRYLVGSTQTKDERFFKTGFSRLLNFQELHDPSSLTLSLQLFENESSLKMISKEGMKQNRLRFWIGDDLSGFTSVTPDLAVFTIPYYVNRRAVGVLGLLGPSRIPYREIFGLLHTASDAASHLLTHNLYKFKIHLHNSFFLEGPEFKLLENKAKK